MQKYLYSDDINKIELMVLYTDSIKKFEQVALFIVEKLDGEILKKWVGPEGSISWLVLFGRASLFLEFDEFSGMSITSETHKTQDVVENIIAILDSSRLLAE